jgi:predicted alpha-1,6-mannanase (GH76 family)
MVQELIDGMNTIVSGTPDFASWNTYNDDIMWAVIALVRGYEITGNYDYLSQVRTRLYFSIEWRWGESLLWAQAEVQFNAVWSRGWDTVNGGMYWNTDRQTKNACVNGPTAIAAFLLSQNTVNTGFLSQVQNLFVWVVILHLFLFAFYFFTFSHTIKNGYVFLVIAKLISFQRD